mmetsp:Transcript_10664/g.28347  ORF Transcript_10664/g.28347 Transcript_10664/m.28347 type:complete len:500 (+) Transcript_10664:83-1582(+)
MTRHTCQECGSSASSSEGWETPYGYFFCAHCWSRWQEGNDPNRSYAAWILKGVDAEWGERGQKGEDQDTAKRQRRRGPLSASYGCHQGEGAAVDVGRLPFSDGAQDGETLRGCACSDGDWDPISWSWVSSSYSLDDLDNTDSCSLEYCDAHCHLDYVLLNEKYGLEWLHKKKLCSYWEDNGYCPHGDECDYAHGEAELSRRTPLEASDLEAFAVRHRPPTLPAREVGGGAEAHVAGGGNEQRWEPVPLPPLPHVQQRRGRKGPKLRCMITNCCEVEAIEDTCLLLLAAERLLQGSVYCTFGCHPHNYREYNDRYEERLLAALEACGDKVVAWGECGLDYHKNYYDLDDPGRHTMMLDVFARQARLAVAKGLPLVVHSRDAEEDTLKVLREHVPADHPVHIHAYQGAPWMMWEVLNSMPNAVVGVSGTILFPTAQAVHEVARQCPLERLVLETDAPYLAGEPRAIPTLARKVAELKGGGVTFEQVLAITTANCERFYRIA